MQHINKLPCNQMLPLLNQWWTTFLYKISIKNIKECSNKTTWIKRKQTLIFSKNDESFGFRSNAFKRTQTAKGGGKRLLVKRNIMKMFLNWTLWAFFLYQSLLWGCVHGEVMTTYPYPPPGYFLHGFSHLDPSARARSRPTDPTIVKMANSSILLWNIYNKSVTTNVHIIYVKTQ